jgi:hypothetical protein
MPSLIQRREPIR